MKVVYLLLISASLLASCQSDPTPDQKTEAPVPAQQPQTAIHPELKAEAAKSGVEISGSELVGGNKGTIIGKNVPIRSAAGLKSEKAGVFNENEKVQILSFRMIQTEGEGILGKSIVLKKSGSSLTLHKDQKVLIEDTGSDNNTFFVSYEDPKKGRFEAEMKGDVFQGRIFANWHQVQRENGEIGWVMGNYLKIQ